MVERFRRPVALAAQPIVSDALSVAALTAVCLILALGIAALLLQVTGADVGSALTGLWDGSFGSKNAIYTTLNQTAPLLVVAVGTCVAGRAGLFNIGLEGQFLIGGLTAVAVAVYVPAPAVVLVPLTFLAGAFGGGLWAGIAALLRYTRNISEVLSTLLLNFVAIQLATFILNQPSLLQGGRTENPTLQPETELIRNAAKLPLLATGTGSPLQSGILVAAVVAGIGIFVLGRTVWGFKVRAIGLNSRAARRFGIRDARVGSVALIASGAIAGIASALFLTSSSYQVTPDFSNDYGWEGLLIGLVAGFDIVLAIPVAIVYGALRAGGAYLSVTGISSSLVGVLQALIVVAAAFPTLYMYRQRRRRQLAVGVD